MPGVQNSELVLSGVWGAARGNPDALSAPLPAGRLRDGDGAGAGGSDHRQRPRGGHSRVSRGADIRATQVEAHARVHAAGVEAGAATRAANAEAAAGMHIASANAAAHAGEGGIRCGTAGDGGRSRTRKVASVEAAASNAVTEAQARAMVAEESARHAEVRARLEAELALEREKTRNAALVMEERAKAQRERRPSRSTRG